MKPARYLFLAFAVSFVLAGLTAPAAADGSRKVAKADVVLRAGPGVGHAKVGVIRAGTAVIVRECVHARPWCRVKAGAGRGWVSAAYLDEPTRSRRPTGSSTAAMIPQSEMYWPLDDRDLLGGDIPR